MKIIPLNEDRERERVSKNEDAKCTVYGYKTIERGKKPKRVYLKISKITTIFLCMNMCTRNKYFPLNLTNWYTIMTY